MTLNETLFRLPFTGYGLACAFGAAMGLALTLPGTHRAGKGWAEWVRFAVCVLFFGWLGARLMFVLPDLAMGLLNREGVIQEFSDAYLSGMGSALPALYFWEGGYALAGAIPGAILGAKIAEKWTAVSAGFFRDRLALTIPAFMLVERLAEHALNPAAGVEVSASWLIGLGICTRDGAVYKHPVYLYEAILCAAVLVVMAVLEIRRAGRDSRGDRMRFCLILLGLPLISLESFRPLDGHMIIHMVNATQVVMMALVLAFAIRWSVRVSRSALSGGKKAAVLTACWIAFVAGLAAAVWCIFGMEKDWIGRGPAYILIAASMAVIGAAAAVLHRMRREKGELPDGTREDPAN